MADRGAAPAGDSGRHDEEAGLEDGARRAEQRSQAEDSWPELGGLYNLDIKSAAGPAFEADKLSAMRDEYMRMGGERSNTYYGYIAKKDRT